MNDETQNTTPEEETVPATPVEKPDRPRPVILVGKREKKEEESAEEKEKDGKLDIYYSFQSLVVVLSALVLMFTFVGRLIMVDGISMVPTLLHGEMMLVRSVGYTPEQGDIVVLTQASFREEAIVKRVIAKGGQTVNIDYAAGTVTVDGVVLSEPYINEPMLPRGDVTSMTVPEGCIFVMGDNRNVSADSRYNYVGVVDERRVIGQAVAVIFPFGQFEIL